MVSWYRTILFCQYFSLVWNHWGDLRSHGDVWIWDSSSLIFHIFVLRLQWAKKLGWLFLAVGGRSSMLEWQLTATLGEVRRHCVETSRPRSTRRYAWWSGVLQAVVTNYHRGTLQYWSILHSMSPTTVFCADHSIYEFCATAKTWLSVNLSEFA